jgi:hypothetical protein
MFHIDHFLIDEAKLPAAGALSQRELIEQPCGLTDFAGICTLKPATCSL